MTLKKNASLTCAIFALLSFLVWVSAQISTLHAQETLTIGDLQGDGDSSPFEDQTVTFEAVVTGLFEDVNSRGNINYTLFVQDRPGFEDGDPATSDGMAIFVGSSRPTVTAGDHVEVSGQIVEFFGLTEIGLTNQRISVIANDTPLPDPIPLAPPALSQQDAYFESLENMLVRFADDSEGTVVDKAANGCAFTVALGEDASTGVLVPILHNTDVNCDDFPTVELNEKVVGANGPLIYNFEEYKIVNQNPLSITISQTSTLRLLDLPEIGTIPQIANNQLSDVENLLITEVYYTTIGSDEDEEWIEITNLGVEDVDLTDFRIGDEETAGEQEGMARFPTGALVEGGRSIIVAQNAEVFQQSWGFKPNFELANSDQSVPTMRTSPDLATGSIALSNEGDEVILLDPSGGFVDGLSYGGSAKVFKPPVQVVGAGESIERVPADCDNDVSADWQPQRNPSPGLVNFEGTCDVPEAIDADNLNLDQLPTIGSIQGAGEVSPFVNQTVAFEGVITGLQSDQNTSGITFFTAYVQDIPGKEDGLAETSDAIPLFFGRDEPPLQIGDHVIVIGQVIEYFGLTEIADDNIDVRVISSDNPLPTPIEIDPPATDEDGLIDYYESLEGMVVSTGFSATRVVGATFSGCGFAVVRQESGLDRVIRQDESQPIGQAIAILNDSDTECADFPDVKVGDEVNGLTGPLTYNFEQYRLVVQNFDDTIIDEAPFQPLPEPPTVSEDQFSIISFNVENFFDGIDDTGLDAEPKLSEEEIERKQTKIANAIGNLLNCPTIIAIQEVEKGSLLEGLAEALVEFCAFEYDVVHFESADGRGIDVAYLIEPERVELVRARLMQGCTTIDTRIQDETVNCNSGEQPLFSRPPLRMEVIVDGRRYILFNNHFKSKRGGAAATERRRVEQAEHINRLVSGIYEQDENARVIVLGDFNDYEKSAPLLTLEDGGLFNVLSLVPAESRYTFVFSGISQLIDGMLVSPRVEDDIAQVDILHINADYPDSYQDDISAEFINYKATDHDIPFLVLNLDDLTEDEQAGEVEEIVFEEEEAVIAEEEVVQVEPVDESSNLPIIVGGGVAMLAAAAGGFYFGRKRDSENSS